MKCLNEVTYVLYNLRILCYKGLELHNKRVQGSRKLLELKGGSNGSNYQKLFSIRSQN